MGIEIKSAKDLLRVLEESNETYQKDKKLPPLTNTLLDIKPYINNLPDIKEAPEYDKAKELYDSLIDICLGVG